MNFWNNIHCAVCKKLLGRIDSVFYNAISDLDFYCDNCEKED
jgi:phage FluMu protein Com